MSPDPERAPERAAPRVAVAESPTASIDAGPPRHVAELDGFRALAVLAVLVCHLIYAWPPAPPAALSWMPRIVLVALSHGWLGVDLFFVLSGFLISGILLDARAAPHYFRNFYTRRALRILPLYLVCILLMSFAYRSTPGYFGLSLLFLANFSHLFQVATPHGPSVFWSLSVEEHFYLLWPLLVRFLTRSGLFAVSLLLVIGTPLLRGYCAYRGMDPESQIYPYSFFRFDGLALGAILAMWTRSRYYSRASAWKLAALLAGIALLATALALPFGVMQTKTVAASALRYTQAGLIFGAAMALALAYQGGSVTAILRTRFFKLTAGLSYCIYLIHLSLGDGYFALLRALGIDDVARFGSGGAVAVRFVAIGCAAFALAALSKRFLEGPMLRLKRYVPEGRARRPLRSIPTGAP